MRFDNLAEFILDLYPQHYFMRAFGTCDINSHIKMLRGRWLDLIEQKLLENEM